MALGNGVDSCWNWSSVSDFLDELRKMKDVPEKPLRILIKKGNRPSFWISLQWWSDPKKYPGWFTVGIED